ncbi:MAG TPA: LuxR C-terminal-related transcriptional regulator [Flavobacteriaceae bacterium]|nr:DNA-binding response regulator [Flavobacteriaceae bacterium]MCB9212163.1 DNA-binding response regulator [Alteromonas sp.]HPF10459.1 LuxR C-terminal-related transcriptional regulator [Flavobacteriaceae bacterium]HQU21768.1 LuxR C-terminal-related transcriptional regulator [Flavobacteriaceae bacterium]HQU64670.1 LuxR C-terminal-related transcriptional regulator [Flavobacteriaceae bacterium]
MKKTILTFSGIIFGVLALFQLSHYQITYSHLYSEVVVAIVAVVFLLMGLFIAKKKRQTANEVPSTIDHHKIENLGISKREYEILQKISEGLSNKEIGARLFVSEHTVKTHVSNLFQKLEVKRRTQAVQKAKELNIIA